MPLSGYCDECRFMGHAIVGSMRLDVDPGRVSRQQQLCGACQNGGSILSLQAGRALVGVVGGSRAKAFRLSVVSMRSEL